MTRDEHHTIRALTLVVVAETALREAYGSLGAMTPADEHRSLLNRVCDVQDGARGIRERLQALLPDVYDSIPAPTPGAIPMTTLPIHATTDTNPPDARTIAPLWLQAGSAVGCEAMSVRLEGDDVLLCAWLLCENEDDEPDFERRLDPDRVDDPSYWSGLSDELHALDLYEAGE